MAKNRTILSLLFVVQILQRVARGDFTSVNYYSKDLTFPAKATTIVATPTSDARAKYFYYNYLNCDDDECVVAQNCFNCPRAYQAKKCHISLPREHAGRVSLRTQGDRAERIVVDWVSRAAINESSAQDNRTIQVIDASSCLARNVPIELSGADNGMRKIVPLDPALETFDLFYIDYRACHESGWVKQRYNVDGKLSDKPECIHGLDESRPKFLMDVAVDAQSNEIILDKGKDGWILYELKSRSNRATAFHKGRNVDLFDVARLAVHGDNFGSLCWLADIELSYSLNCTIFRVEPRYARQLRLDFHYRVRDFELAMVDFKRVYALTSPSDYDTSCVYDLWIFDVKGSLVDGPLRIQGPQCVFSHRLEPRPRITHVSRDEVCVSFAFERPSPRRATVAERRFTLATECFAHVDSRA